MHNPVPSPFVSLLGSVEKISVHTVTTGFSVTVEEWADVLILDGTATLATGTIVLPVAPRNGHVVTVITNQIIQALTVSLATGSGVYSVRLTEGGAFRALESGSLRLLYDGARVGNAPTCLNLGRTVPTRVSGFSFSYIYAQASAAWYRLN